MSLFNCQERVPRWAIDHRAVSEAAEVIGLQHPVKVKYFPKGTTLWGQHDPLHIIRVNSTMPKREVTFTIWHELGHALQCERDFNCSTKDYLDTVDLWYKPFKERWSEKHPLSKQEWWRRYNAIPMEVEANALAERFAYHYPLTV